MIRSRKNLAISLLALAVVLVGRPSMSQDLGVGLPPEVMVEITYVENLLNLGLAEYADIVMKRINYPGAEAELKVLRIRGGIAKGEFDAVKATIAKEPDQQGQTAWAMRLTLADGYYAWGKYEEARAIYKEFFTAFPQPPKAIENFFLQSAYKYAQMLLLLGDEAGAAASYELALKVLPKENAKLKHIRRQFLGELAELLLRVAEKEPPEKRGARFKRIKELLDEILWLQDLWFGKGIVIMAHMEVMQGNIKKAMAMVEDYMPILKQIDEALRQNPEEDLSRLSPIAQVRYLIGKMMHEEAEKMLKAGSTDKARLAELLVGGTDGNKKTNGAFQHFVNVFIRYPGTSWAPDAGIRMRRVREIVEKDLGGTISFTVTPEQMSRVEVAQFGQARVLFNQGQYKNAAESYINVLNLFPEGDAAPDALTDLATCYIEMAAEDPSSLIYADMIVNHLAERFAENKALMSKAGNNVLRLAGKYRDAGMPEKYEAAQEAFFTFMPKHPQVPDMLFYLGEQAFQQEGYEKSLSYHTRVMDNYPDHRLYFDSLNRVANCYRELGNKPKEIQALKLLESKLTEAKKIGYLLINTKYQLASAYNALSSIKNLGPAMDADLRGMILLLVELQTSATAKKRLIAALRPFLQKPAEGEKRDLTRVVAACAPKFMTASIQSYDTIIKLLTRAFDQFGNTPEERAANTTVLEASKFFKAMGYAKIKTTEEKKKLYIAKAIEMLKELLKSSEKDSKLAPTALSQLGTYYILLDQADEAQRTLKELKDKYPDSPEARNADYILAMSLLELDRRQEALRVFKKMFDPNSGGTYSDQQIVTAGRELLKAGEGQIALDAFTTVFDRVDKGTAAHQQAGLGKGRALLLRKDFKEAAKVLEELKSLYEKSRLVIDIAQGLVEAYSELGSAEKQLEPRIELFNKAINEIKLMRTYAGTNNAAKARNDIELARIHVRKKSADLAAGDQEAADQSHGDAVQTYQTFILFCNDQDQSVRPYLATAYAESTPLLAEKEQWKEVKENCDGYFERFPADRKYGADMRRLQSKARVKLTVSGESTETEAIVEEKPQEIDDGLDKGPAGAEPEAEPEAEAAADPPE